VVEGKPCRPRSVHHTVGMATPSARQLRDLLEPQLRREVRLRRADPLAPSTPGLSFAVYVDHHLATRGILVVDLAAAAHLGAAAGLVPAGVAATAVTDRALPPLVAEGLRGLLATMAPLFGPEGELRLYTAVLPGETPPTDVASLAAAPGQRLDVALSVRAYGEGRLSAVSGR
jgi:hypothetical protein